VFLALACAALAVAAAKKDYSIKIKAKTVGTPTVLELKSGSDASEDQMVNYQFTNDAKGRMTLTQLGGTGKMTPVMTIVGKPTAASFLQVEAGDNATTAAKNETAEPAPAADSADDTAQAEKDESNALPPLEGGSKTVINGKCKVAGKGGKETKLMTTTAHSVAGVAQWVLLTHEDFSEVKDWVKPNGKKIQEGVTCFQGGDDGNADAFLGPRFGPSADCGNSFFSASKTFTLPEHTEVMVTGRYHFIDQWTGTMHGFASTDGVKRWVRQYEYCTKMFSAFCREYSISVCGDERFPEKLSEKFSFSYPHTKTTLKLDVGMDTLTANAPTCTQVKSWGVDDIQIWIKR